MFFVQIDIRFPCLKGKEGTPGRTFAPLKFWNLHTAQMKGTASYMIIEIHVSACPAKVHYSLYYIYYTTAVFLFGQVFFVVFAYYPYLRCLQTSSCGWLKETFHSQILEIPRRE